MVGEEAGELCDGVVGHVLSTRSVSVKDSEEAGTDTDPDRGRGRGGSGIFLPSCHLFCLLSLKNKCKFSSLYLMVSVVVNLKKVQDQNVNNNG